ncbi:hypothetical protein TRVL_08401 [Trypanosoma vivax]|nr:hypothetical protein TRVL_08401 [Trypanosoma vivax]
MRNPVEALDSSHHNATTPVAAITSPANGHIHVRCGHRAESTSVPLFCNIAHALTRTSFSGNANAARRSAFAHKTVMSITPWHPKLTVGLCELSRLCHFFNAKGCRRTYYTC